jgi:hypothetical protein
MANGSDTRSASAVRWRTVGTDPGPSEPAGSLTAGIDIVVLISAKINRPFKAKFPGHFSRSHSGKGRQKTSGL